MAVSQLTSSTTRSPTNFLHQCLVELLFAGPGAPRAASGLKGSTVINLAVTSG